MVQQDLPVFISQIKVKETMNSGKIPSTSPKGNRRGLGRLSPSFINKKLKFLDNFTDFKMPALSKCS